ncbi:MAG: dTMP kinase [Clostridiales bacterium]|nr:dTMP kinase [Clostridiales bacterium]
MRGKFVTFEGCEGSGKSTQLRFLGEYLMETGVDFIMTREPGGSPIAEDIRKIILNGSYTEMCDECEALLYAAARLQHLKEVVEPALSAGKLVICDRYVDSSFAYQGYARGLGAEFIKKINSFALEKYPPDLTVFLDISPQDAFARKHGADLSDRMEKMGLEFHQRVYEGYKKLQKEYPRFVAVDCSGTKFETAENIKELLKAKDIIK